MDDCILCGNKLVSIVYGFPTQGAIELAKSEVIALGGIRKDNSPEFYCYGCHSTF